MESCDQLVDPHIVKQMELVQRVYHERQYLESRERFARAAEMYRMLITSTLALRMKYRVSSSARIYKLRLCVESRTIR